MSLDVYSTGSLLYIDQFVTVTSSLTQYNIIIMKMIITSDEGYIDLRLKCPFVLF